ncbi:MAG: PAS domain-containing hybrid sensor histidine kinase/response regulator [Ilumatobacteraceae bacterium]
MDTDAAAPGTSSAPPFAADLAELVPVAMGLLDTTGRVVWTNAACRELFRWDPTARPEVQLSELIDPSALGLVRDIQNRLTHASVDDLKVQVRMRRLDGTFFEAAARGRVVRYGPDGALGMVGTVEPITDATYDNPFRRALDLQRELICEWSPGGTILFCNRSYRDFFGYGDDVIGRNLDEYVKWEDGDSRELTFRQLLEDERNVLATRTYDDGRTVEWANTLVRSHDGDPISILGVGRDVTERFEAEAALRHNEERFRTMVMYIWDSILLLDANGQLVDATSAYRADLDYPPGFWQDAHLLDVLHPDDRDAAVVALASLVERGHQAEAWMEVRARRADGNYTWLELNGANLLDDPTVNAIILTVRNIDNRKRIEFELAQRHAESQAALRSRVGFVAQVSHELRNPLHGMLGLSEMLAKADLERSLKDAAWALYRQSTTMRRIVDDLLDVAQLEVGTLRVHIDRVDLQYVFNDCLVVARELAEDGVLVSAEDPELTLRFVRADADRVRQAVVNLLSNACKHTTAGSVHLSARPGAAPRTVRVFVEDTGSGIDHEDIARLFEPYERGTREGAPGVGLGLAIVKGTIEAMGGTVGGAPRPGGGSQFWIELPLGAAEETVVHGASQPVDHHAQATTYDLRVLVVEDDPVNRLLATMQLRELGTDIVTAASGDDAWPVLQQGGFDVAFVDVQMPGMSGLELVRLVRTLPPPHPMLAVMTASATAADHAAALDAGADLFVPKPAPMHDIRAVLQRAVDLRDA